MRSAEPGSRSDGEHEEPDGGKDRDHRAQQAGDKEQPGGKNGDNGIQTSEGCLVVNSASFDNETDGFDVAAGSLVKNCTASDNGVWPHRS